MSSSNCHCLSSVQISQETGQVVWYSHLLKNFPIFCDPHKGFGIVNKAEVDVFLELSCFFDDPMDIGNLIFGSSAFSKSSLNIQKFTVLNYLNLAWRILIITLPACELNGIVPSLSILWHCLSLGLEWKTDIFQSCAHCCFSNLLAYWVQHFHSIIFYDLK